MLSLQKPLLCASLSLFLLAMLTACGEPADGEEISAGRVTAKDLNGYWYHQDSETVLAFQSAEDAYWDTYTWINEVFDWPVSTAWFVNNFTGLPDVKQAAIWSVSNGSIQQTVLAEADANYGGAGTQYSTDIVDFHSRQSMTLESGKTFVYGESCADALPPGHFKYRATVDYGSEGNQACTGTYFVGYAGLDMDPTGGVHSVTTIADNNFSVAGTSLYPCSPLASSWDGGCDARRWVTEYSDSQALTVDPETMTVHSVHSLDSDGTPGKILYRIRNIGEDVPAETFTVVDPLIGSSQVALSVYARGDTGTVIVGNTIYRRNGRTFTEDPAPTLPDMPTALPALGTGTFAPDGRIYMIRPGELLFETTAGVFDTVPLPRLKKGMHSSSIAVGSDGMVHLVYAYENVSTGGYLSGGLGVYARYDGEAWHETEIGVIGRTRLAVTQDNDVILFHSPSQGALASYYLSRILPDDTLDSWQVIAGLNEADRSIQAWVNPVLAVGGGRAAYSVKGLYIGVTNINAFFDQSTERPTTAITITFNDDSHARVVSDDGRVDCTATCTVELPVGRYLRLSTIPDDGFEVEYSAGTYFAYNEDGTMRTSVVVTDVPQNFMVFTPPVSP